MFGWFWICVQILLLIPTSNHVSFNITYIIVFTIVFTWTDYLIDFAWMIWIFQLQRKKVSDFLCFPILKSYFSLMKSFNIFSSCWDTFSFSIQNDRLTKTNRFWFKIIIIRSCALLSKVVITLCKDLIGYPAVKNVFPIISLFSW